MCRLGLLLLEQSCAQHPAQPALTADSAHPALVSDAPPHPEFSGAADAGVVALTPRPSEEVTREIVRRYFRAITDENAEDLAQLFVGAGSSAEQRRSAANALGSWKGRFARLDYTSLKGELLYHERDVQFYRYSAWQALQGKRPFKMTPSDSQVVVIVPMTLQTKHKLQYFGSDVHFLVEPSEGQPRIVEFREDFRLP